MPTRETAAPGGKRAFLFTLSLLILAALYVWVDGYEVAAALWDLHWGWMAAALAFFVPQTWLSALRWQALVADRVQISTSQSVRMTLASSALNLVLPSKLGDFSKAMMLPQAEPAWRWTFAGRIALEKAADVSALLVWAAICWVYGMFWGLLAAVALCLVGRIPFCSTRRGFWMQFTGLSLLLWWCHLAQIALMIWSVGPAVDWQTMFARIPWAIFAGLLPVSLWGIGTRDAALVWCFADIAPAAAMAGVGLLTALRYLIPGLAGIPYLAEFWPQSAPSPSSLRAGTLMPTR